MEHDFSRGDSSRRLPRAQPIADLLIANEATESQAIHRGAHTGLPQTAVDVIPDS